MKKIILLSVIFFVLPLLTHANEDRYSGSVVLETNGFDNYYWYIEPESKTKLLLKDGNSVSRLLKTFSLGINNTNLNKLNLDDNTDYELLYNLRGKLLLQVEANGIAWYINPLDNKKYKIKNGNEGLKTLQSLAILISSEDIDNIPITDNLNFNNPEEKEIDFSMYWKVQEILKYNYYKPDTIKNSDLFYGSLKGIADSLNDPYTEFFTPVKKKNFDDKMQGELEGIGAMVEVKDNRLIIVSPLDDSPAEKSGLLPKDQVLKVDNIDIRGYKLEDSVELIKGPKGTDVVLEIYRPLENKVFEVTVTRDKIIIPTIIGEELDNNIAYFKINLFSNNLKSKFNNLKKELINDSTKGIIIDLRNNPGGYTSSAINLADYWLNPNELIFQEKYPTLLQKYSSRLDKEINLPTIILTNSGTASASEIFTLALKKHTDTKIIGEQTFGKGTGQGFSSFSDGSALKYTIFEWLDPDGISIQDIGIEPDYIIENTSIDNQLNKAKELLK